MVQAITEFFLDNHEIVLPGIGQLKAVQHPARYDAGQQLMLPPIMSFQWKPAEDEDIDSPQALMAFLSRKFQWSEEESFEAAGVFTGQVRTSIKEQGEWIWPGMGKLVALNNQNVGFVPDGSFQQFFKALPAVRAIHAGRSHQMMVGDKETNTHEMQEALSGEEKSKVAKWWWPALIVGVLTISLIVARLSAWI